MATVIPVDEFISDEWYPGFKPGYTHAPWYIDPVQTFRKEDEENFWFLDFHWPRGLTPMGLIWNEDGYNWASQLAAEQMPLPPGRGITSASAAPTPTARPCPLTDPPDRPAGPAPGAQPAPFLQNFDEIWGRMREEVNESWDYFRGVDLSGAVPGRPAGEPLSRPGSTTSARSRSTSRSCTPCWPTTSASTACAQSSAWTPARSASSSRATTPNHGDRPGIVAADRRGPLGRP